MAKRINVSVSDADYAVMSRVADVARASLGTWSRGQLVLAAIREEKRLRASGELADFEQMDLLKPSKQGGRK